MTTTELAERMEAAVLEAQGAQVIALRALANEAGLVGARTALRDQTDDISARQKARREASDALAKARDEQANAVAAAEWELGTSFAVRGNKTWLVRDADAKDIPEDQQRSMTADEKAAWITRNAATFLPVQQTSTALRKAELAKERADDDLKLAERRWTAARIDLEAATGWLVAMSNSLKGSNGEH